MVSNICGNKSYYYVEIYNGIINNPELKNFFISFTQHYNKMSQVIKNDKMKTLEEKRPSLDEVNDLIERITKSGITISGAETIIPSIKKWYPIYPIIPENFFPFQEVRFNDVQLFEEDWSYFFHFDKDSVKVPRKLDKEYKEWKKDNRNIDKEINKIQKRIVYNNQNFPQYIEDKKRLDSLSRTQKIGKQLKSRIEFFKSLDFEQKCLLSTLFKLCNEKRTKYKEFFFEENSINVKTEKEIENNISVVYDEFINNSLVMIDIDSIIEKLSRIILICELKELKERYTGKKTINEDTEVVDIKYDVVEWFVNQNYERIKEMFDFAFEDMETISNTLVKKQNKKL